MYNKITSWEHGIKAFTGLEKYIIDTNWTSSLIFGDIKLLKNSYLLNF